MQVMLKISGMGFQIMWHTIVVFDIYWHPLLNKVDLGVSKSLAQNVQGISLLAV